MRSRLALLLSIGSLVLAAVVVVAGIVALRAQDGREALRAWAPSAEAHPAWAAALGDSAPSWQISRPTADSVLVEYQIAHEGASLYTAAMRERDAEGAALSQQAFLAAQVQALADGAPRIEADFAVGDEAACIRSADALVAVARQGRAVVVLNAHGLPQPEGAALAAILEAQLARILAAP